MKTNLLASAAALILFGASASADVVIESKVESPELNATTTSKIKGGKVRTDLTGPMGAVSSIMDSTSGDAIQVIHGQKMVIKMTGEQVKQAVETAKKEKSPTADYLESATPEATGQKEKIGEYDCEIYTWKGEAGENRYWIALDHPQAKLLKESENVLRNSAMGKAAGGPDTSKLPGPALKTEIIVAGVKVTTTILSIKEANVDPSEFEVPKDYKDMSALLGGGVPSAK